MNKLLLIGLLGIFLGCNGLNFSEKDLVGRWQAVQLTEGQDTFAYDISQVQLNFGADQKYSYQGNLRNREAGKFYLIGKILYTTDTLVSPKQEKAVEIKQLANDSMQLLMNEGGKMRMLQLVRKP